MFYFDPDMVVFDRFSELEQALCEVSILPTPHQSDPSRTTSPSWITKWRALTVFSIWASSELLTPEKDAVLLHVADRLTDFCLDDIGRGLFTDQKWANLILFF